MPNECAPTPRTRRRSTFRFSMPLKLPSVGWLLIPKSPANGWPLRSYHFRQRVHSASICPSPA